MVFLHSRINDGTTVHVIRWLICENKSFFRLNVAKDVLKNIVYDIQNPDHNGFKNTLNNRMVYINEIGSFFFHGGHIYLPFGDTEKSALNVGIANNISSEVKLLLSCVLKTSTVRQQFGLSPFATINTNKLHVLELAKNVGFDIPMTAVVSKKVHLRILKQQWGRIITKNIDNGIIIETEDILINGQRTEEVSDEVIEQMHDDFYPSLIQKLIEKELEIRTFYFNDTLYSVAIFSQNNDQTKIDFRNYDMKKPSRIVPFELPSLVKEKISLLMKKIGLNYASIDIILGSDGKYYFLEANPYGQFGFLSQAGNYYLEKEIAAYLN